MNYKVKREGKEEYKSEEYHHQKGRKAEEKLKTSTQRSRGKISGTRDPKEARGLSVGCPGQAQTPLSQHLGEHLSSHTFFKNSLRDSTVQGNPQNK